MSKKEATPEWAGEVRIEADQPLTTIANTSRLIDVFEAADPFAPKVTISGKSPSIKFDPEAVSIGPKASPTSNNKFPLPFPTQFDTPRKTILKNMTKDPTLYAYYDKTDFTDLITAHNTLANSGNVRLRRLHKVLAVKVMSQRTLFPLEIKDKDLDPELVPFDIHSSETFREVIPAIRLLENLAPAPPRYTETDAEQIQQQSPCAVALTKLATRFELPDASEVYHAALKEQLKRLGSRERVPPTPPCPSKPKNLLPKAQPKTKSFNASLVHPLRVIKQGPSRWASSQSSSKKHLDSLRSTQLELGRQKTRKRARKMKLEPSKPDLTVALVAKSGQMKLVEDDPPSDEEIKEAARRKIWWYLHSPKVKFDSTFGPDHPGLTYNAVTFAKAMASQEMEYQNPALLHEEKLQDVEWKADEELQKFCRQFEIPAKRPVRKLGDSVSDPYGFQQYKKLLLENARAGNGILHVKIPETFSATRYPDLPAKPYKPDPRTVSKVLHWLMTYCPPRATPPLVWLQPFTKKPKKWN